MVFTSGADFGTLSGLRDNELTKLLGWPGYRVHRHEINERAKTLKLWIRRKRGNRKLVCSGCGRKLDKAHEVSEREVRDLPCMEFCQRWWWKCTGSAVRTVASRWKRCRSCRAKRRLASASRMRWGKPARVRRHGKSRFGSACQPVRCERSTCDTWSVGPQRGASRRWHKWAWM